MADNLESNKAKMKSDSSNGCGEHCDGHHHSNEGWVC